MFVKHVKLKQRLLLSLITFAAIFSLGTSSAFGYGCEELIYDDEKNEVIVDSADITDEKFEELKKDCIGSINEDEIETVDADLDLEEGEMGITSETGRPIESQSSSIPVHEESDSSNGGLTYFLIAMVAIIGLLIFHLGITASIEGAEIERNEEDDGR